MTNQTVKIRIGGTDVSEFTIVRGSASKDCPVVTRAADDLAKYIRLECGAELTAVFDGDPEAESAAHRILLGETRFDTEKVKSARATLKNSGCAIICEKGDLFITGADATGTLYGTYVFLEDYANWRFYSSTYETFRQDRAAEIADGTERIFSPKIFSRDTFWFDTFSPAFAAKQKINGFLGRDMSGFGEQIKYAGGFVHTLPELAGTSREPDAQPCLTDPAIYEKVLAGVRKRLRENPGARIISVSQNDSYPEGRGCQCENCRRIDEREGTPMGSLLKFVNRIAGDIKDEFPGVYVDTLAYRYTRKAPKYLRPADNVIIRLCSIECCFSHPLDGGCERNLEFTRDFDEWASICSNLFIWDYTTDFLYYNAPFPNLHILYDDIKYFADRNAVGLFEQGNGQSRNGEFDELRAYLIAKMMWDPDMSRERYFEYMDDFLEGFYGAGWKHIREYIDETAKMAAGGHMGIYYPVDMILGVGEGADERKQTVAGLKKYWDDALALADRENGQYSRVEKSSLQIRFTDLYLNGAGSPSETENLYGLMKKYGIDRVREGGPLAGTPDFGKSPAEW